MHSGLSSKKFGKVHFCSHDKGVCSYLSHMRTECLAVQEVLVALVVLAFQSQAVLDGLGNQCPQEDQ